MRPKILNNSKTLKVGCYAKTYESELKPYRISLDRLEATSTVGALGKKTAHYTAHIKNPQCFVLFFPFTLQISQCHSGDVG